MNRFIIISLVAVIAACAQEQKPAAQTETTPPPTTSVAVQEQTVDVSGTFTPASLTIPAGQPVRIHFRRGDKPTCADEIVFPDLGIRKKLAANQTVTVDLPAQQARTLTFVCGMNMMKGTVVVQ